MGIQPIDLQTLYTQMEKVGKQVAGEQKAKEEENVKQAETFNRELIERKTAVQEMNESGKINVNKDGHNGAAPQNQKPQKTAKPDTKDAADDYFTDPELGRKIDFSG